MVSLRAKSERIDICDAMPEFVKSMCVLFLSGTGSSLSSGVRLVRCDAGAKIGGLRRSKGAQASFS